MANLTANELLGAQDHESQAQLHDQELEISHRYRIVQYLGSGRFGQVFIAADTMSDRKVAIKLLPKAGGGIGKSLLSAEMAAWAKINHPSIPAIYEVGVADENLFVVMEYVEGETLRTKIMRGPLEPKRALEIITQVASALSYAHSLGVIHRDLKPENICIDSGNRVKILDFGLAVRERNADVAEHIADVGSPYIGTPAYMSPEQIRGEVLGPATDVHSLGVVFYEMLTGKLPYAGSSLSELLESIATKEPIPLSEYVSNVPKDIELIVRKSLEKDQRKRYERAEDLAHDLEQVLQIRGNNSVATDGVRNTNDRDSEDAAHQQDNQFITQFKKSGATYLHLLRSILISGTAFILAATYTRVLTTNVLSDAFQFLKSPQMVSLISIIVGLTGAIVGYYAYARSAVSRNPRSQAKNHK